MFTLKVTIDLGQSSAERFLDRMADYLDSSGFTDLEREPARVIAKKGWPSGSVLGTLATLAFCDSAVVEARGNRATIQLGTSRNFIVSMVTIFAVCMVMLGGLSLTQRAMVGAAVAVVTYLVGTFVALVRAKIVFAFIAKRCAPQA